KVVSREPVVYVRNIYKYYVAYKLLSEGKVGDGRRDHRAADEVDQD
ncbi:hypothetical protein SAMN05421783_1651, partial [Thiocapsa roseopersicina]